MSDETAVSGDYPFLDAFQYQDGPQRGSVSLCDVVYGDNTATPDDCCSIFSVGMTTSWVLETGQWSRSLDGTCCRRLLDGERGLFTTCAWEQGANTATPFKDKLPDEDDIEQYVRRFWHLEEAAMFVFSTQRLPPLMQRQLSAAAPTQGRPLFKVLCRSASKWGFLSYCCIGDNTATPATCDIMSCETDAPICPSAAFLRLALSPCGRQQVLTDSGQKDAIDNSKVAGENTATPGDRRRKVLFTGSQKGLRYPSQCKYQLDAEHEFFDSDNYDPVWLMQGLSPLEPRQPFAVASERGRPLLDVLRLARRTFTETWLSQGHDVAYTRFRPIEPGLWEKKILGWKFLAYEQPFGIPFCAHLLRTGLWASQLISPFEDEGYLEILFVTVTPQPLMLCVAGSCKTLHDTAVLAVVQEVYSSDRLLLVVEHAIQGTLEVGSLQCPIACTPTTICIELGFEERCRGPCIAQVYFRLEQTERIFTDEDRIGLPMGSFVHFSLRCLEVCDEELPAQRPVREHEMLIIAQASQEQSLPTTAITPIDDATSMMQFGWMADMANDESEYLQGVKELVDRGEAGFTWPYPDMIKIDLVTGATDHLRFFLATVYSFDAIKLFTIHVWQVQISVTAYARISVMRQERSFTEALKKDWSDLEEVFPMWGALASPQPLPLNLRIMPIDMILLTDQQRRNGDRIYLVDILFLQLPRRVALLYRTRETLENLVERAGLTEVCHAPMQHCVLVKEAEGKNYHWELHQVVDQRHATTFRLEIRRALQEKECKTEVDRVSMMQTARPSIGQIRLLQEYLWQWYRTEGSATFWVHNRDQQGRQEHPTPVGFDMMGDISAQLDEALDLSGQNFRLILVDPPPVLLFLPRPHVIVSTYRGQQVAFLCQTNMNGRRNLMSLQFDLQYPPLGVATVFDVAMPGHPCEEGAQCYVLSENRRWQYHHDIEPHEGRFYRLFVWTRDEDSESTCTPLSVGSEASLDDEWPDLGTLSHGDFQSLMQVGPPQQDLVSHYVLADALPQTRVIVCTWFHPIDAIGQPAQISQLVYYNRGLPGGPFFRSIWDASIGWETCLVVPVKPKPIEDGELHPHVLVTALQGEDIFPVLCEYKKNRNRWVGSLVLRVARWPTVFELFTLIEPANLCGRATICTIKAGSYEREQTYYLHMRVPLYEGALLRMKERTMDDDGVSTECDAANSTENDHTDEGGSSDATAGTAQSSNESEDLEEMILMQRSTELRPGRVRSWDADEELSTIPSRPPNSSDSSFSLPYGRPDFAHVRAFDWLLTWGETRRHVAAYLPSRQCRVFRTEILVHATFLRNAVSTSAGILCPYDVLRDEAPISDFIWWCQSFAFTFDSARTQAFPVLGEVYQNTPSIIVVDSVPIYRAPILIHVSGRERALFFVLLTYRTEQVATITSRLSYHIQLTSPLELRYNGQRVHGGQHVELHAGGLFQVRFLSQLEMDQLLPDTREPIESLDQLTHDTWTSLPPTQFAGRVENPGAGYAEEQSDEEHTLPPRGLELWQEGLRIIHASFPAQGLPPEHYYWNDFWQVRTWQHRAEQAIARTDTYNVQLLLMEATALHRARGFWPEFVICLLPDTWYRGRPEPAADIGFADLVYYLRWLIQNDVPLTHRATISAVRPFVTPAEQQGEDALFLLVDRQRGTQIFAAFLIEDSADKMHYDYWPMRLDALTNKASVLQAAGLTERCSQPSITCLLQYDMVELPIFCDWRSMPGMKLNLYIQDDEANCECESEEISFMQMRDARFPEHADRVQSDIIYRLLAEEPSGSQVPPGGVVQTWLLPGTGAGTHDASTKIELRPVIDDWTGWVQESWRSMPPRPTFLMVKRKPPPIRPGTIDYHIIGTDEEDVSRGMRTLLVDLTFANVLRRGAVRSPILSTVAEIAHLFSARALPIDSPLLQTFRMQWHDGTGVRVYKAFQVPEAPTGAFVQIVPESTHVSTLLSQPVCPEQTQELLERLGADWDEVNYMQLVTLTSSDMNDLRGARDPLFRLLHGVARLRQIDLRARTTVLLWRMEEPRLTTLSEPEIVELDGANSDWSMTAGVAESAPGQWTMMVVQPCPPLHIDARTGIHILAFRHEAFRHLLVDLVLQDQVLRFAVQCSLTSTVLDVYRSIAQGSIRLLAMLSTSFTLTWESPEGRQVFRSYEVPQVPSGAFVRIEATDTFLPQCREERDRDRFSSTRTSQRRDHSLTKPLDQETPDEDASLLQTGWHRPPTWRLKPPGNPTLWKAQNMFSMDDWIRLPDSDLVIDHQPFAQPWAARSKAFDCSGQTGDLPIPPTGAMDPVIPKLTDLCEQTTRVISIDQALAPRMNMPDFTSLIEQICRSCDYGKFPYQMLAKCLPAEVKEDYESLCRTAKAPYEAVEIYTDGSYMPDQQVHAGWSFAVLIKDAQGWCLYDFGYGRVVTDALESGWVGCTDHSARAGEGTAIIRGLEWAVRESLMIPHAFCFDAQTVGYGVGGTYGLDRSDAFMVAGRSLAKATEAVLGRQLEWRYVKAHSGQVGNEIADALAKHAVLETLDEPDYPEYIAFLGGDRYPIEQLWMTVQTGVESHVLPPIQGNQAILTPMDQTTGVFGRIVPSLMPAANVATSTAEVYKQKWNFLTYNVSSLQPRKSAFYATYLREQIAKAGYEVSFLQETRCRESQMLTSQSHYRLTSAAEAGRGGVEIWLLREKEHDSRTGFRKEMIQVLHAEPLSMHHTVELLTKCITNFGRICRTSWSIGPRGSPILSVALMLMHT